MIISENDKIQDIISGLETAYIDSNINSNLAYRPEFISNDYKKGKKVLVSIENELRKCDEFSISVAFITKSGITPLLQILKELEEKNIPGKILTTNYLNFSEPEALSKLSELKNIELKMFCTNDTTGGFHTKGYIFREQEIYKIIIGSSNMTLSAITKNREWNTKIVSTSQGKMANEILEEFNTLWNDEHSMKYNEFIEQYRVNYEIIKKQKRIANRGKITSIENYKLKPNKMQIEFITNLKNLMAKKCERALLISATGTGKTYASAFAMRELGFKKVLFLVHREQILKQAQASYKKVLPSDISTGLLSGNYKETEADYLFSTIQTMSRSNMLENFERDRFECIIIDDERVIIRTKLEKPSKIKGLALI